MRVGILGGTFDPIHKQHLVLVQTAYEKLNLDQVWMMPAKQNPLKEKVIASSHDRLAMINLAIANIDWIKIKTYELDNSSTSSYLIDTMQEIKKDHPHDEFFFIIGADNLKTLPQWKQIDKLSQLLTFVVVNRPHFHRLKQIMTRYRCLDLSVHSSEASSTNIRKGDGLDYCFLNVIDYINNHGLYLKQRLEVHLDSTRLQHCLNVSEKAVELANHYHQDKNMAKIAGAYHDITKQWGREKASAYLIGKNQSELLNNEEPLWHAFSAAYFIKDELKINDEQVFSAIFNHTSGKPNLSDFDLIILLADKISKERDFDHVQELHQLAFQDLKKAFKFYLKILKAQLESKKAPLSSAFMQTWYYYHNY